ncbi:nitronate monooxygenase [Tsukamurella soli]|uniref:NAD(P)H-dependent flavin oxidoreductase n=1 Tax=Tsukamurella soli TaxID=644556 RepID=UPI0031F0A333
MLTTWFTRTFGVDAPILGAPMANRAGGALAAAVTAGGGVGLIGVGHAQTPEFDARPAAVARATGPFGAGLMCWALDKNRATFDAVVAERPDVMLLSFGDPAAYVLEAKAAGAVVGSQVNTLDDLRIVEAAGVDFVIAQGSEAGGHTGHIATLSIAQQVLDATQLPVLVAGGIATGRGVAAALAAGAAGVMVGTALLASGEADAPDWVRERILGARAEDTLYTDLFDRAQGFDWPARWGGRLIRNEFADTYADATNKKLRAVYDKTDPTHASVYAGEAVELITELRPAATVVATLAADAERQLRSVAGLLGG